MRLPLLLCSVIFAAAATGHAETTADFLRGKLAETADNGVESQGPALILTQKIFEADPAKKYELSGEFRAPAAVSSRVYFGLQPLNRRRQPISPRAIMAVKGSETTLAADCKAGEKSFLIEPNAQWKAHDNHLAAFDVKTDLSDLPNFNFSDRGILSVEPENGKMRVHFRYPLRVNRPAGTAVRMHVDGATYLYTGGRELKLTSEWKKFSGKITGTSDCAMKERQFPVGTSFVRIVIYVVGKNNTDVIQFRDLKFKEIR